MVFLHVLRGSVLNFCHLNFGFVSDFVLSASDLYLISVVWFLQYEGVIKED
jgi:hypothetical protein